jgi:putative aminopeptidase FrvX
MALPDVLRSLLTAQGTSGYEAEPAGLWRDAASAFADVRVDDMGNSYATVKGTADGLSLGIIGHIDEIGLIVTHVDDSGFLYFTSVGGWDPQILVGQRVTLTTRDGRVPGVVGKKPIHLIKPDERDKGTKLTELHIDIGAADGDEARGLVRTGDTAVITGEPVELLGGRAISRAMDNRLGACIAYEAARLVAEAGGSPGDVVGVAAVQEEIGLNGARAAAFSLRPDVAIVVDVTHATDAPGVEAKELGEHKLGSGAVIERGAILNPKLFELLHEVAEAEGIPVTVAASGRGTGTDADVVHMSRGGIPTTIVAIPLRYMHSPVEMVEVDDVLACARLIAAFAQRLTAGTSFAR